MKMEQQAPQAPGENQEGGENQLADLVKNIGMGLAMLNEVLGEINPELAQAGAQVEDGFKGLIEKLSSSSGAASPNQGMAPEMAGRGGAVPGDSMMVKR